MFVIGGGWSGGREGGRELSDCKQTLYETTILLTPTRLSLDNNSLELGYVTNSNWFAGYLISLWSLPVLLNSIWEVDQDHDRKCQMTKGHTGVKETQNNCWQAEIWWHIFS